MTLQEQIEALRANRAQLTPRDREFAESLLFQHGTRGLSAKQAHWVGVLADRAAGEPQTVAVADSFTGVTALFDKAARKLKRPAIVLDMPDGAAVRISLAPKDGHNPGFIYAKIAGEYAGKIAPNGTFTASGTLPRERKAELIALLASLAKDPAGIAAAYGKRTGGCCFCNTSLTDERSLEVGYGPVCAKHYDLPWGKTETALPLLMGVAA